jgi:hypothetical protein
VSSNSRLAGSQPAFCLTRSTTPANSARRNWIGETLTATAELADRAWQPRLLLRDRDGLGTSGDDAITKDTMVSARSRPAR